MRSEISTGFSRLESKPRVYEKSIRRQRQLHAARTDLFSAAATNGALLLRAAATTETPAASAGLFQVTTGGPESRQARRAVVWAFPAVSGFAWRRMARWTRDRHLVGTKL